jgi:hypothetical protein
MATKEEKCEFCGCRGSSTVCYYDCGCHKPKDEKVLPKKWEYYIWRKKLTLNLNIS